ncbi:rod shape-determining protein MreC [Novosphingobium sp.]|uniref:rod shape-determining protein MreC n=1 Tax=Novosphingobium sp. TaxID=1874826 RepID=UPI0027346A0C|nr:rod shape-determining protein MreC [Novosphingobium sp.]MDP3905948.1 rod shape-determining protein MreC [Novosphingobium sp.]
MLPPANRRPGYSRRAQYGNFLGYLIAFTGLAVGAGVLLISTGNSGAFSTGRTLASDVTAPAGELAAKGRTETRGVLATLGGFFTSGSHVAKLEREVAIARVQLREAEAIRHENTQLKALLKLAEQDPRPVAISRLIGSTSASTRRFAVLGVGTAQGVKVGMPVRSPLGLVGRVLEVGRSSARVLLITDTESVVPVRRASDGIPAFATGRADGSLQLRLINIGINPLKPGDAVVTSGSGGLYWPGTAVAVITELTRDGAIARPLSDPGSTEFVEVQPLWTQPALSADLPAPPGASPPEPQ